MDPVTLMVGSMAATAIGGGISAYGAYAGGQAQRAMYNYQAGYMRSLGDIADKMAAWDIMSGEVKAQQAGEVSAANLARTTVRAGAGNVGPTTGSTAQVYMSQLAIGQQNESIQRADAAHAAFGEAVKAEGYRTQSGIDVTAGEQAYMAGVVGAAGEGFKTLGSVAGKWYDLASTMAPAPPGVNPDSAAGRDVYAGSIFGEPSLPNPTQLSGYY